MGTPSRSSLSKALLIQDSSSMTSRATGPPASLYTKLLSTPVVSKIEDTPSENIAEREADPIDVFEETFATSPASQMSDRDSLMLCPVTGLIFSGDLLDLVSVK